MWGIKGGALCEKKKRAKPVNLKTRAKLQKERAKTPVQPPSYHLLVALKYLRWVFVLDVTNSRGRGRSCVNKIGENLGSLISTECV